MARSSTSNGRSVSQRTVGRRKTTATRLLERDHEIVQQLFRRFEKAGDHAYETKQGLFEEIQRELDVHARIEEEIFYPAVEREAPAADDLVREAIEEHDVAKTLLTELGAMSAEDTQFDPRMKVLIENVRHHIEEEEGQMFPKAQHLPEARLLELGAELKARQESLRQPLLRRIVSGVSDVLFGGGESPPSGGRRKARAPRRASGKSRARATAAKTKGRRRTTTTTKRRARGGAARPRRRTGRARAATKRR